MTPLQSTIPLASDAPASLLALVGALLVLGLFEAWHRGVRNRAWLPALLRSTAMLCGAVVLAQGSLDTVEFPEQPRRLAVLFDDSASLAIRDELDGLASRAERRRPVAEALRAAKSELRRKNVELELYGFDADLDPWADDVEARLAAGPSGGRTALEAAMRTLAHGAADNGTETRGQTPLAGVVVVSDGQGFDPKAVASVTEDPRVPVSVIPVGGKVAADLAITELRAAEIAFVGEEVRVEGAVVGFGFEATRADITLDFDGRTVARTTIAVGPDGLSTPFEMSFTPMRLGQFAMSVEVSQRGASPDPIPNHRRTRIIQVMRDRVKVLHVAGRPDWDVRALRTMLRRDPNVELLSYYILRGFDDADRDPGNARLSLIPFPTDDLFSEQLDTFDLVILHNFDPFRHEVGRYLDNIARYVLEGGALVLIGGDLGTPDAQYGQTALSKILPVDARRPAPLDRSPFRPTLTAAGRAHPLTAWIDRPGVYDDLPEFDVHNRFTVGDLRRTRGAILLAHPDDAERPVAAVSEPGKGRALVLASPSTWRWAFAPRLPTVDGARPYDALWLRSVRWLLRDEASERVRLETDKPHYLPGEKPVLRMRAMTPSYAPEAGARLKWTVTPIDGDGGRRSDEIECDEDGTAAVTLEGLTEGTWAATAAHASSDEAPVRRVFVVSAPPEELADVDGLAGANALRALAAQTGGRELNGDELSSAPLLEATHAATPTRRRVPLWHRWPLWLAALLLLGAEWFARRRLGLA